MRRAEEGDEGVRRTGSAAGDELRHRQPERASNDLEATRARAPGGFSSIARLGEPRHGAMSRACLRSRRSSSAPPRRREAAPLGVAASLENRRCGGVPAPRRRVKVDNSGARRRIGPFSRRAPAAKPRGQRAAGQARAGRAADEAAAGARRAGPRARREAEVHEEARGRGGSPARARRESSSVREERQHRPRVRARARARGVGRLRRRPRSRRVGDAGRDAARAQERRQAEWDAEAEAVQAAPRGEPQASPASAVMALGGVSRTRALGPSPRRR